MNKCTLVGRMVKDAELKFLPSTGTATANFTIAVNRMFKKEGQPTADFINIVIWGKQAENTANYTHKGSLVAVSGRIQTRSYDAKDGTKRYITEVVAEEVQFLDKKESETNTISSNPTENAQGYTECEDSSDIPF